MIISGLALGETNDHLYVVDREKYYSKMCQTQKWEFGEPIILFLETYLLEIFTCVYKHITKEVHSSTVC